MKIPCKDCPNRVFGCHSKCQAYKDFAEERRKILEAKNAANKINSDFQSMRNTFFKQKMRGK